jgi:hypothetical protein
MQNIKSRTYFRELWVAAAVAIKVIRAQATMETIK